MKNSLVVGLGIAIVGLLAIMVVVMHEATRVVSVGRTTDANQAALPPSPVMAPEPASPEPTDPSLASPPQTQTVKGRAPANSQTPTAAATPPVTPDSRSTDAVIPESMARQALSFVGVDPDAEEVWYTAINDPNLSAHARRNLIEDLNEDGFADPRNPTQDELPLIMNRLLLIEEVASEAMDEVNAAAFQEAYRDLLNMYARLTGQ